MENTQSKHVDDLSGDMLAPSCPNLVYIASGVFLSTKELYHYEPNTYAKRLLQ